MGIYLTSRLKPSVSSASVLKHCTLVVAGVSIIGNLSVSTVVFAAGGVSQGFNTNDKNVSAGTLMGLSNDHKTADPAISNQSYQLLGLVADQPLLALSDGSSQVQVTVSGPAEALVSDINGPVKSGDKITASPIKGIGMRATDAGQIVGTAQSDASKNQLRDETIKDKVGKELKLKISSVNVQVSVGYYAGTVEKNKLASALPPFILSFASSVAGQQVSPVKALIGVVALIFGFIIVANMLQAAIRSGIIAVGRNPLAKTALRRELRDVLFTALAVLVLTVIIVYAILKI